MRSKSASSIISRGRTTSPGVKCARVASPARPAWESSRAIEANGAWVDNAADSANWPAFARSKSSSAVIWTPIKPSMACRRAIFGSVMSSLAGPIDITISGSSALRMSSTTSPPSAIMAGSGTPARFSILRCKFIFMAYSLLLFRHRKLFLSLKHTFDVHTSCEIVPHQRLDAPQS